MVIEIIFMKGFVLTNAQKQYPGTLFRTESGHVREHAMSVRGKGVER